MKVSILQHDIVWGKPAENCRRLEKQIAAQPGADLYVLAEMWPTGFAIEPEGLAECDKTSLLWMKQTARCHNAAIAGSIAVEQDGKFYNRFYFVKPDGTIASYDKRHLFTYGGEDRHYTRGNRRVVVEWMGVRFLLAICYDLRFPVWTRNRQDYDAIIYVANWPTSRIEAWSTLLRARAIENQCYVIGVNRVGADANCEYCGGSAIIDPYGCTIAAPQLGAEQTALAEIDMERLETFRDKFPVLEDGDWDSLNIEH
ncbi:MAG: amidohydrolase [Bacteroidaceae bacterium]|nr:amidohydrolase [Bacteroidaceae bacterium]